jgi:1-acyl-sn-glycerol-3-phosphate acyltransferase
MTGARTVFRYLALALLRGLVRVCARLEIRGRENIPRSGPLIIAINHLGHADPLALAAALPYPVEFIALIDLLSVPGTGQVLRAYGVIPVHRDQVDRTMLRRALGVLEAGGVLVLAPEARMSVTGELEQARAGLGYLALRSGAPVMPVAITGTDHILDALKHLRRPEITITFAPPSALSQATWAMQDRRARRQAATDEVMLRIARLLPPEYRGEYAERV